MRKFFCNKCVNRSDFCIKPNVHEGGAEKSLVRIKKCVRLCCTNFDHSITVISNCLT